MMTTSTLNGSGRKDAILKAKQKPLEELTAAGLGVDVAPKIVVQKLSMPPSRKAGIKVPDVPTLVQKLKAEAKVI